MGMPKSNGDILGRVWQDDRAGAADPKGAVAGQRFVLPYFTLDCLTQTSNEPRI
jgi:hypothetical protein